jgi:ferrous iron transport protein B
MAITPAFEPLGIERDNWPATVGLFTGIFAKEAIVGSLNAIYGLESEAARADAGIGRRFLEALSTIPSNLAAAGASLLDPLGLGVISPDEGAVAGEIGADSGLFGRLRENFSPPAAYAYLLFVLIYFPCAAALAAAIREMGVGLGWILGIYSTALAWTVATLYYQFATGPRAGPVLIAVGLIVVAAAVFSVLGRTIYRPAVLQSGGRPHAGDRGR